MTVTEQEVSDRALEAGRIIESTAYQQAWAEMEKKLVRDWMQSKSPADRENLWLQHQNLKELHRQFESFLSDGKALARKKMKANDRTSTSPVV